MCSAAVTGGVACMDRPETCLLLHVQLTLLTLLLLT
jgi:hypothetical protein